jgi:flavoprotein
MALTNAVVVSVRTNVQVIVIAVVIESGIVKVPLSRIGQAIRTEN